MGKGSGRRPLLISEQEAEDNWNKIFKKEFECNGFCGDLECPEHQDKCKRLNKLPEYELNKSTGEVEKRFIDGVSKPNGEQFGDKSNAVKP